MMEDQSMLCMFEGDTTSFLEELTGPVPTVSSMGGGEGPGMMQAQDQQGIGPTGMAGGPGMQNMGHMQQQQQQHPGWGQQQQAQKLHHYDFNQQNMGPQGMMSPGSQGSHFGSPPLSSPQPPAGGFNYQQQQQQQQHQQITPPRQPTPQPHGPQQMWNQSPGSQGSNISNSPYGNMQQPGTFSGHHDYALPPTQAPNTPPHAGQRMPHYQQVQGAGGPNYQAPRGHMGSPPPNPHIGPMHRGAVNVQFGMQSANVLPVHQQNAQMQNMGAAGYMQQQQRAQMPMSSANQINGGQIGGFVYSQQGMVPQQQTMPRYQQAGGPQQQAPHPQQPPQHQYRYAVSAAGMPTSSQGTYTTQAQQPQPQHIMPRPPSTGALVGPNAQTMMRPNMGPMSQQQMPPQVSHGYLNNQSMVNAQGGMVTASTARMPMTSVPTQSAQSAASLTQQQQQLAMEINQLQQQINQLYSMPQAPQTQQKMLDVQERMRTLKAQQQQLLMQQQRQQQPQQQQQQYAQQMGQPGAGGPIKVQQIQVQQPGQMPKTIIIQRPQQQQQGQQQQQPQQQFIIRQQQQQPQQHNVLQIQALVGGTQQQVPTSQSSTVLILPSTITTTPSTLPHPSTQLLNSTSAIRPNADQDEFMSPALQLQVPDQNGGAGMGMTNQRSLLKSNVDELKDELNTPTTSPLSAQNDEDGDPGGQQEKANKIIQEAIAKAQAEGRPVPAVVPPELEGEELGEDGKKKKKAAPKRERKKKDPKDPKEVKPKKTKKAKELKEGESPPKKKKVPTATLR